MSDGQHGWHPAAPRPAHDQGSQAPIGPADPASSAGGPASQPTPPRHLPQPFAAGTANFDAVGMQSVLTRARDQSRFEAPEIEPDRVKRPFPLRALLAGMVGVLVFGVAAGGVYVNYLRPKGFDPNTLATSSAEATDLIVTQTPQEIVTNYFAALASGDITTALAMGPRGGQGSADLLTPEAYSASLQASPLTAVELHTTDPEATEVAVTYRLGGHQVETSVELQRLTSGDFQLRRTTMPIQGHVPGGEDVPLIINGVELEQDQIYEVVPGTYTPSTGLPNIAYPSSDTFTITELSREEEPRPFTGNPELTEAGRRSFITAASDSLARCISQKLLAPAHCPFGTVTKSPVDASSIKRELTNDPFANARASLNPTNLAQVEMSVPISISVSYNFVDGSRQTPRVTTRQAWVTANVLGEGEIAVTWAS